MCLMNRFQQILLVLLNIGHTRSGSRNIVRLMNMMALPDVAVANEWRSVASLSSSRKSQFPWILNQVLDVLFLSATRG